MYKTTATRPTVLKLLALGLLTFTVTACTAAGASARADGWTTLGSLTVNPRGDRDVIRPSKAADYTKIRLRASIAPVVINDVKVHFVNGQVQDIKIQRRLRAGQSTRVIDLVGGDRHIEKITLWYRTPRGVKRAAVVTVTAKR